MGRRQVRAGKQEDGFTLVETLIGMVLTAMIAIAISVSMRTAVATSSKMARNDEAMEAFRMRQIVGTWIAQALPGAAWGEAPETVFVGDAGQLIWTVEASGRGGARLVRYTLAGDTSEDCPSANGLVLSVSEYSAGFLAEPVASDRRWLLPCAGPPAFQYMGNDGSWRAEWRNAHLPRLIRISIGETGPWLVVRPRYAMPAAEQAG